MKLRLAVLSTLCALSTHSAMAAEDAPAPKIAPIIGALLSQFASNALQSAMAPQAAAPQQNGSGAPCYFNAAGDVSQQVMAQLAQAGCQLITQRFTQPQQQVAQYLPGISQLSSGQPQLARYGSGAPNYHGVKVTVLMTDPTGQIIGERPIGGVFYNGERFRLKVQPTFDGLLEIEHIGPSGMRTQLFPKPGMNGFLVTAGREMVLPLGNAVYEFDADRGNERLIFKVRDPRITAPNQYGDSMLAQNVGQSTFLGQQMPETGQYPYIAQSIDIQHR